jgi:hypothetical protein
MWLVYRVVSPHPTATTTPSVWISFHFLSRTSSSSSYGWGLLLPMITASDTRGGTPLDEGSARGKDLYLTTHDSRKRQTSMPQRDSNPKPQQASGQTPRPLESIYFSSHQWQIEIFPPRIILVLWRGNCPEWEGRIIVRKGRLLYTFGALIVIYIVTKAKWLH